MNVWDFLKEYISKKSPLSEWIGVIGTLILAVLALFGNQIRKSIFRPKLEFINTAILSQSINSEEKNVMYRLIVKNKGAVPATNVRAVITKLREGNEERKIILIPLNWTNIDAATRDISRQEVAYLDVLAFHQNKYFFCWPGGKAPYEKTLMEVGSNKKSVVLYLEFFESNRKLQSVKIIFNPNTEIFRIMK